MRERRNSIANALELRLSRTNPSSLSQSLQLMLWPGASGRCRSAPIVKCLIMVIGQYLQYMMTSSNGNIFKVTGLCEGKPPVTRSLVDSPHKDQWLFMFSLICGSANGWASSGDTGDFRRHRAHYDVTVMKCCHATSCLLMTRDGTGGLTRTRYVRTMPSQHFILFRARTMSVGNGSTK